MSQLCQTHSSEGFFSSSWDICYDNWSLETSVQHFLQAKHHVWRALPTARLLEGTALWSRSIWMLIFQWVSSLNKQRLMRQSRFYTSYPRFRLAFTKGGVWDVFLKEKFFRNPHNVWGPTAEIWWRWCVQPRLSPKSENIFSYPACELWRTPIVTLCDFQVSKYLLENCSVSTQAAVAFNLINNI